MASPRILALREFSLKLVYMMKKDDMDFIFAKMREMACHASKVTLKCETLTVRSAFALATVLADCPEINELCFETVHIEEFGAIAVAVGRQKGFSLAFTGIQNLTAPFISNICCLLRSNSLYSLTFRSCNAKGQPLDLSGALRYNCSLRTLTVSCFSSPLVSPETMQEVALMLQNNGNFETLEFSSIGLSSESVCLIAAAAEGHQSLKKFVVSHTALKLPAARAIGQLLKRTPSLRTLDLSYCCINRESFGEIACGLEEEECALEELILDGNDLGHRESIEALTRFLKQTQTLKRVHFVASGMWCHSSSWSIALACNNSIEELFVDDNRLGPEEASDFARYLTKNNSVKKLCFDRNVIGDEGAAAFATMLMTNVTLENLKIGGFGSHGLRAFATRLPDMFGIRELCLKHYLASDYREDFAKGFEHSLETNTSLESLIVYGVGTAKAVHTPRTEYLMALNRGGRRVLDSTTPIKDALWPLILGRSSNVKDVIFHVLREKSDVLVNPSRIGTRAYALSADV